MAFGFGSAPFRSQSVAFEDLVRITLEHRASIIASVFIMDVIYTSYKHVSSVFLFFFSKIMQLFVLYGGSCLLAALLCYNIEYGY